MKLNDIIYVWQIPQFDGRLRLTEFKVTKERTDKKWIIRATEVNLVYCYDGTENYFYTKEEAIKYLKAINQ